MKTLLTIFLAIFTSLASAAPTSEFFSRPASIHTRLPYLVWKPEGYAKRKDWPLIVFLHGMGERGWDLKEVAKWGLPKWLNDGHSIAAVVVAPQVPDTRMWENADVDAMIDEALAKYAVDPDRVILTGFSMGGFGTFDYAAARGWRLAAIAPVAGGLGPRYFVHMKGLKAWVFSGEKDTAVPAELSREAVARMRALGLSPAYTEFKGADHLGAARQAYEEDSGLYKWMLEARRNTEPVEAYEAKSLGFEAMDKALLAPGKKVKAVFVARNLTPKPKPYRLDWKGAGPRWKFSPASIEKTAAPGAEIKIPLEISLAEGAGPVLPYPKLNVGTGGVNVQVPLEVGMDNSALVLPSPGKSQWAGAEITASHDGKALHFTVRCLSATAEGGKLKGRDQDLWEEDSVELFISPSPGSKEYAQFIVNKNAALFDAWAFDRSWNSGAKPKARLIEGGWEMELSVPFEALKVKPAKGLKLGFEAVRNDVAGGKRTSAQWAPTFGGNHMPERFGVLELAD